MSILRQLNVLGQMRLDVPHLRMIESAVAADFDVVAGRVQAGGQALVIRGFSLTNFSVGTAASSVQLSTADGIVYNLNASESGSFLWVPANRPVETLNQATNPRVIGSFTAGQTNYVGIDFIRSPDASTSDLVQFLDPNTLLEQPKTVPLGRTLDYEIVITTAPFSANSNLVPVAKIVTDGNNNVVSVQDARSMMWRLAVGSDFPNSQSSYTWPQGRTENVSAALAFQGGDKAIPSMKDWASAIMTRIWEIGGGENWYSPTADRNVHMTRLPSPAVFLSTGDNFEFVSSNLHWQGLRFEFENSNEAGVYYNIVADQLTSVAGLTDLTPGQCVYVDLVRSNAATVTALKANLQTLGTPVIPGSRFVIAWCNTDGSISTRDAALPVNTTIQPATTVAIGGVRLSYAAGTPATPTVPPLDINGAITLSPTGTSAGVFVNSGGTGIFITGSTIRGISITSLASGANGIEAIGGVQGDGAHLNGGFGDGNPLHTPGTGAVIVGGGGSAGQPGGLGASILGSSSFSFSTSSNPAAGDGLHVHGGDATQGGSAPTPIQCGTAIVATGGNDTWGGGGSIAATAGPAIKATGGSGHQFGISAPGIIVHAGGDGNSGTTGTQSVGGIFYGPGAALTPSLTTLAAIVAIAGAGFGVGGADGVEAYGTGVGSGIIGTSGEAAGGYGLYGIAKAASNNVGVYGTADGTGLGGVKGLSGSGSGSYGVYGLAKASSNNSGSYGQGDGTGTGVVALGGILGDGVHATAGTDPGGGGFGIRAQGGRSGNDGSSASVYAINYGATAISFPGGTAGVFFAGPGGSSYGAGVFALGYGGGAGGLFQGGAVNGGPYEAAGVVAIGAAVGSPGIIAAGGSTGNGGIFLAGGANQGTNGDLTNTGIAGVGNGAGDGVGGFGGALGGSGIFGLGGAGNGIGVVGTGNGTAVGGSFNPGSGTTNGTNTYNAIQSNGYIKVGGNNPGFNNPIYGFSNTVTPKNVVKAWARIQVAGGGGGAFGTTIEEGFNVVASSRADANTIRVTFQNGIHVPCGTVSGFLTDSAGSPTIWYHPVVVPQGGTGLVTTLDIILLNGNARQSIDAISASGGGNELYLIVMGYQ